MNHLSYISPIITKKEINANLQENHAKAIIVNAYVNFLYGKERLRTTMTFVSC